MVLALQLLLFLSVPVVTLTPLDGVGGPLPVSCGLLRRLPAGFAADRPGFLLDAEERAVPAVFHGRAGHWTLHALVESASGPGALRTGRPRSARPGPRLVLGGDAGGRTITTGGLTWETGPGARVGAGGWDLAWFPEAVAPEPWRALHACPLRAGHAIEIPAGAGRRASLHLTHHAGTTRLDTAWRLEAGGAGSLPEGSGVRVLGPGPLTLTLSGGARLEPGDEPRRLVRGAGGWSEGERLHPGDGSGRFLLSGGGRELSLLASPAEGEGITELLLEAHGRALVAWTLAPEERLARGEGQILRVTWDAAGRPPAPRPLVVPGLPALLPWTGEQLAPRRGTADALLRSAADAAFVRFLEDPGAGRLSEGAGTGDWLMPDRSVGNQEYDGVLAFSARAFAGDPRALAQARAAADHALGRDWDALGSGLQFPHGRDHRTGPVEAGHHWIEGLHLLVLWEQDPLLQEQLVRLVASQQAWFAARDLGRELPRSLAWGLLALSAAVPLSATPEQARGELRRWRRHVLGRQGAEGFLHLSRDAGDGLWRVHPFVQGGILLRALVASRGAAPGAGVRAAVQALARALVREALVEDEQGRTRVARSLVVEARSGSVVSHQGLLAGEEAALVLAGLLLADRNLAGHGGLGALRADLPSTLRLSERRRVGQDLVLLLRALAGLDASGAR